MSFLFIHAINENEKKKIDMRRKKKEKMGKASRGDQIFLRALDFPSIGVLATRPNRIQTKHSTKSQHIFNRSILKVLSGGFS
jgi:hypothetical protein